MANKFSTTFKELRQEKGKSQRAVAKDFHVSQAAINRWENEQSETDFDTLIIIADYFNVSTDYLLGRISYEEEFGKLK